MPVPATRLLLFAAGCLALAPAPSRGAEPLADPLAEVARQRFARAAGRVTASGRSSISPRALELLRSPRLPAERPLAPAGDGDDASPSDVSTPGFGAGDVLVLGKDDDFATSPVFEYEGPLAVSSGPAGPSDYLAFRFATQDLAHELPVEVTAIQLGLDNLRGRTVWPLVGLAREDLARPFEPALPLLAQVAPFADPATLLSPPAGAAPDAFARLPVTLSPVSLTAALTLDDGMWSDAFDRVADELLDHTGSDWVECDLSACVTSVTNPIPALLNVTSRRVVKRLAGDRFAFKFPAAAAYDRRPYAEDRDLAIAVSYDVTDTAADRAGLFFRYVDPSQFYLAQYRKSSSSIGLWAFVPGNPPVLLRDSGTLPSGSQSGTLAISVSGSKPVTHITVSLDGTPLFTVDDGVYAYVGRHAGLASLAVAGDAPSSLETWDAYVVRRNPDVFAVVQMPAGGTAALPGERSPAAVEHRNVLASTDGTSYSLLGAGEGCVRSPGGFVSLEVRDTTSDVPVPIDNVFQVETRLATLPVTCAACPTTLNLCAENPGPLDRLEPVLTVGLPFDFGISWWNDHVVDSRVMFEFVLWDGECGMGAPLLNDRVIPVADGGQLSAGARHRAMALTGATYTPLAAGTYCVEVYELYDLNADGCADGFEGATNCSNGTCRCTSDPDQNPATFFVSRELMVHEPCTPDTLSELVPNSLRLTRNAALLAETDLYLASTAPSGRFYNLHQTSDKRQVAESILRTTVPPYRARVFARTPIVFTETLPDPAPGGVVFAAIFQTDGCPSNWSLVDP